MENKPPILRVSDLEQDAARFAASSPSTISSTNQILDGIAQELRKRKREPIHFAAPIIGRCEEKVFYPNTINMVQGQTGVHKSRLTAAICAAILRQPTCTEDLLGFRLLADKPPYILYVDTERNLTEQFPYALQRIQLSAGYALEDEPSRYLFTSLVTIERVARFQTLSAYLAELRATITEHIFIILDVVSDCVSDFNRTDASMQLIDLMNQAVNHQNVTFLVVLHENYGSEKARGHLGSELFNKCSTVLQIAGERDGAGELSSIFRVKYLKCRNSERYQPFYVRYDETIKNLILADNHSIETLKESRQTVALLEDVADKLEEYLHQAITGKELLNRLVTDFKTSEKTLRERLKTIETTARTIYVDNVARCLQSFKRGTTIWYHLVTKTSDDRASLFSV